MADLDNSFHGNDNLDLLSSVVEDYANLPGDSKSTVPMRLASVFDGMVKPDEGMKVYLRVRPSKSKEDSTINVESDTTITTNAPESSKRAQYTKTETRHYMFTRVFGGDSTQNDLYDNIASPLYNKFLRGENCVLFAYGMTNAGKTYTVQGTNSNPGILPRLVTAILDEMNTCTTEWDLHVSMLEIYQESIFDLLAKKKKDKLTIRDANGKVEVNKLSTHSIRSTKEAIKLMDTAAYNRTKSSTFLNTGSSRSHAVYTITLDRSNGDGVFNQSVAFQLVDLAGAERGSRTKATGAQQKEANNINMSLMQLWRCLQGMKKRMNSDLGSSQEIIPFRESKLTHLLMPILNRAGMSGTAMIACVNPQVDDYDETISILSNASVASKIKEICDVGRTAGGQQGATALAAEQAAKDVVVQKAKEAAEAAAALAAEKQQLKKRKAADGKAVSAAPAAKPKLTKAASKNNVLLLPKEEADSRDSAGTMKSVSISGSKRKAGESIESMDSEISASIDEMDATDGFSSDHLDTIARLAAENAQLKETIAQLEYAAFQRETDIRMEAAMEMDKGFRQLRDLNQSLQDQLEEARRLSRDSPSSSTNSGGKRPARADLTKSVKKARKAQMKRIQEGGSFSGGKDGHRSALQEAEDELERLRSIHDEQNAHMKEEMESMSATIEKLQGTIASLEAAAAAAAPPAAVSVSSGGPAGIMPPSSVSKMVANKFSNLVAAQQSAAFPPPPPTTRTSTTSTQVAAEFASRFGKKNDENAAPSNHIYPSDNSPMAKSPAGGNIGKSPSRSPLSDLKNQLNVGGTVGGMSPTGKNYQIGTQSSNLKRIDSPQRVRGEGETVLASAGAGYPTRLRSIRA